MNKPFPFISNWKITWWIGTIGAAMIGMIMIFLQPFDTYSAQIQYKPLKLLGYSCIYFFSYLLIHLLEMIILFRRLKRWTVGMEAVIMLLFVFMVSFWTYIYQTWMFDGSPFSFSTYILYTLFYGLPFAILIIPLTVYLRHTWGNYEFQNTSRQNHAITIVNSSGDILLEFNSSQFIFSKAQQNYVEINLLTEEGRVKKELLRMTLNDLAKELPYCIRIHRSYLINLSYISSLEGNKRKSFLNMKYMDQPISVSPKNFESIKKAIQSQP